MVFCSSASLERALTSHWNRCGHFARTPRARSAPPPHPSQGSNSHLPGRAARACCAQVQLGHEERVSQRSKPASSIAHAVSRGWRACARCWGRKAPLRAAAVLGWSPAVRERDRVWESGVRHGESVMQLSYVTVRSWYGTFLCGIMCATRCSSATLGWSLPTCVCSSVRQRSRPVYKICGMCESSFCVATPPAIPAT